MGGFTGPLQYNAGMSFLGMPAVRFWQISKPYLNQGGQIIPSKLQSPPSDFQTFRHPCYIQCHGQDMAISIMVTVHNNETILICSLIRLLNTALSSIFFFLSNYPIFPLSPLKENMSIGLKLVESDSVCKVLPP